jgi:hypothetical protein
MESRNRDSETNALRSYQLPELQIPLYTARPTMCGGECKGARGSARNDLSARAASNNEPMRYS